MKINNILISPVLTEKATGLTKSQVFMFKVAGKSTKPQIKNALEKLYNVKVGSVTVSVRKGKTRRVGRRMKTQKVTDVKVAYVKLISGKIDVFPQA